MTRQRILHNDTPLRLAVVLDEGVLLRRVGGPQVMRGQLEHLAEAAAWPNMDLRVLVNGRGARGNNWGVHHSGIPGADLP